MNIDWLHCFVETVKHKSLSKASEKLNLTQPALSKQIKNLEDYYQTKLFHRSSTGMELTEEGSLLYQRILPVLSELASIQEELENQKEIKALSIAALPSLAAYFLPKPILQLENSGIKTKVNLLHYSAQIVEELMEGKAHIGLLDKSASIPKRFWRKDLFTEPYYAVFPQGHRLSHQEAVTMTDIMEESLVVFPSSCDVRQSVEKAYTRLGLTPQISVETPFGESILGLVSAGAGITILPEISAKHISQHALLSCPLLDMKEGRTISLVAKDAQIGKRMIDAIIGSP